MIATPGVANRGNVIDVDSKTQPAGRKQGAHDCARLPGLIAGDAASAGGSSSGA
jgi:hypothetical protein